MKEIIIAMPQMGNSLFRKYMKSKYAQSLNRSGAKVRWIELEDNPNFIQEALECDGLLLPGGADLAPEMYHQTRSEKTGKPNLLRDQTEPKLLEAFLSAGKPILGICRGVQLMNVYFGGTLVQDIKDKQKYRHADFFSRARSTHPVEIKEGTRLFDLLGQPRTSINVNSIHHQAVDQVGEGLTVCAISEDGFVEGIEKSDALFCVGVQWHPEHMSAKNSRQQALFDAFVRSCRERADGTKNAEDQ